MSFLLSYLLVVFAGISFATQQILNTTLKTHVGSPWWAGFVSYLGGTMVMLVVALLTSPISRLTDASGHAPWFTWLGGLFGAIYIAICILMVPKLGTATTIALMVVGQMVGALAFDHFGLLGLMQRPLTLSHLAGAGFLVLGVVLIRA
ncbi:MAG: DMT family transporter [Bdellovibrionales bacterium]